MTSNKVAKASTKPGQILAAPAVLSRRLTIAGQVLLIGHPPKRQWYGQAA